MEVSVASALKLWFSLLATWSVLPNSAHPTTDEHEHSRSKRTLKLQNLETELGEVVGFRENVLGKDLDIFLGIPYAQPPINEKRFQKPTMVDPGWTSSGHQPTFVLLTNCGHQLWPVCRGANVEPQHQHKWGLPIPQHLDPCRAEVWRRVKGCDGVDIWWQLYPGIKHTWRLWWQDTSSWRRRSGRIYAISSWTPRFSVPRSSWCPGNMGPSTKTLPFAGSMTTLGPSVGTNA